MKSRLGKRSHRQRPQPHHPHHQETQQSLHSDTSADVDLQGALMYVVPDEDELLPPTICQSSFKLKKGYTLHTVYTVWGQIDQLCLRQ